MKKDENGFTIIEILSATMVLFIGILGIFSLFPTAFGMADLAKTTTKMALVGQSKMEELMAIGFENLSPGTYTSLDLTHLISDPIEQNRFRNTEIRITTAQGQGPGGLAANPLNGNPALYQIEVDVRYELKPGKEKEELFTTYLSNPAY